MKRKRKGTGTLVGLVLTVLDLLGQFSSTASAQAPDAWVSTGSMAVGRQSSSLQGTLLPDGTVLVAGGWDSSRNALSEAEVYDPNTGVWTATGSMTTPRADNTMTLLPDGKVLVAGGQTQGCLTTSSAEIYDPETGTWTTTGDMQEARGRGRHMSTLMTGGPLAGIVLVSGGYINQNDGGCGGASALASAELYDPSSGTWSLTGSMNLARNWEMPSPAALPDGSVLLVGGMTCCPYTWFDEAESFNPLAQTWAITTARTTTANGRTAVISGDRVLVAGGVTGTQPNSKNVAAAELFDASAGTWTATASMSIDRNFYTLTLLASGQVLATGGCSGGWGVCTYLSSAELYDSTAGKWFPTGSMRTGRIGHAATMLSDGRVLVAGGLDSSGTVISTAELYTPPPVVALSNASLKFPVQLVGTSSSAQMETLTNTGTVSLTISSIAASGDFLQTNTCGSSVLPGASCTIDVSFKPTVRGTRTGTLTITDDAADSPQTVTLAGTGTVVELSPAIMNFGTQKVGTTSPPHAVTLTNTGSAPLSIQGIAISGSGFGDFVETTTCSSRLASKASCAINVRFRPKATGARRASLKLQDDGGGSPQRVALMGNGT